MTDRASNELVTELRVRGYAVLPAPRHVELSDATARVDSDWSLAMDGVDALSERRTLQRAVRFD